VGYASSNWIASIKRLEDDRVPFHSNARPPLHQTADGNLWTIINCWKNSLYGVILKNVTGTALGFIELCSVEVSLWDMPLHTSPN